ncbi:hypothetical protein FOZ60_013051 [Perkinsus olseni]|uniref:Uncharacterized protein n=1 Tax=Perkinsus olseni TaxID=32597 RepID=A0A7J6P9L7_PEROL|nr:hypothetical protein FOZ60_013051 [Perkinsus olseni]
MFSTRIGGDEPEGCIALILYLACGIRPPEPPRKLAPSTRSRKSSGKFMQTPALADATLPTFPYSGPPSDASTADDEGQPSSEAMDSDSPRPPLSRSVSSDELLRIRHGQAYAQSQRISQFHPLTDYFPRAGSCRIRPKAEPAIGAMEAFFDRLFPPPPKRKVTAVVNSAPCSRIEIARTAWRIRQRRCQPLKSCIKRTDAASCKPAAAVHFAGRPTVKYVTR